MPSTAPDTRPTLPPRATPQPQAVERRPFRDNPRLILLGIALLIAALVAMVTLAERSRDLNPDFLTGVVLYALTAADITMLVALVFVLARNVIKLVVERRRGLPFSRFRAKLVLAMLGLTIIPSVLVLLVGGQLIRDSTEQWFSQPVDEVLRSANQIAGDYYRERGAIVESHASRIARTLPVEPLLAGDVEAVRRALEPEVLQGRVGLVEVYRLRPGGPPVPVVALESPGLPGAPTPWRRKRSKQAGNSSAPVRWCEPPRADPSGWSLPATISKGNWHHTCAASRKRTRATVSCA